MPVEMILIIILVFAITLILLTRENSNGSSNLNGSSYSAKDEIIFNNLPTDTVGLKQVKVVRVIDGDTVIVKKLFSKIKVRLDSIDCPENNQPWGDNATYGLIKLIGGKTIKLEEHGEDWYGRTLATLYTKKDNEWINVNERMVTIGHAWVMRAYYNHLPEARRDKLNKLEKWAKSKKVGLWKDRNPVPPWKWRCDNTSLLK